MGSWDNKTHFMCQSINIFLQHLWYITLWIALIYALCSISIIAVLITYWKDQWMRCFLMLKISRKNAHDIYIGRLCTVHLGAVHIGRRIFFGRFWYSSPPFRNFDPDSLSFYLLISCNIGIWDSPPLLKYSNVVYGWPPT